MGDGGSHLIGAVFAGATLLAAPGLHTDGRPSSILAVLLLAVPCADTALVIVTRLLSRRSPFSGGRDHLSHRLVAAGCSERQAVLVLYAAAVAGALAAVALVTLRPALGWGSVAIFVVSLGGLVIYLGHIPISSERQEPRLAPLPTELATQYRGYEILLDVALIALAYYVGLAVRFRDEARFTAFLPHLMTILPLVVALHIGAVWIAGKYRKPLGWNPGAEGKAILQGCLMGSAAALVAVLYVTRFEGYSRLAFAVSGAFALVLLAGTRFSFHALDEFVRRRRTNARPALVYGAGSRGALAVRELLSNPLLGLTPVGIIDDDTATHGGRVEGVRVIGGLAELPEFLSRRRPAIGSIIVSVSLPHDRFNELCEISETHQVEVRRLRFSLDDVERRDQGADIVRFPRA
jgi:UDP-GlcNAc:undecaprenyl-phosphate GlcNAc-1-phosphate transferase